jgi:hypothetical protein
MRGVFQTALLIGMFAASLFSQQTPDQRFVQEPSRPEIVPPGFLADRDPYYYGSSSPQSSLVHLSYPRGRSVQLEPLKKCYKRTTVQ